MLELEHVSAVVAVVCEAVSQPCSPVTYSVSAALLGLTRLLLLVLTVVVACSSNGHQVHVCALLGSACCISFIDATSLPIRLIDSSLNPTPCDSMKLCKQTRQMDDRQTDRRIYFASTLRFCLDSIRSSGPGHDHSCSTQSVAIFALVTLCKALHRNAVNLFLPNRMKEIPV